MNDGEACDEKIAVWPEEKLVAVGRNRVSVHAHVQSSLRQQDIDLQIQCLRESPTTLLISLNRGVKAKATDNKPPRCLVHIDGSSATICL